MKKDKDKGRASLLCPLFSSSLINNYLRLTAVNAVTANKNKSHIGDNAVANAHIGKFYLCTKINVFVVEKFDRSTARKRLFKIHHSARKLIKPVDQRKSFAIQKSVYFAEQFVF